MTAHPAQEQAQQAVGTGSTLVNLSAYLTLDRAREKFGFDPANYNLSDNEAGQIATIFSRFDLVSPSHILALVTKVLGNTQELLESAGSVVGQVNGCSPLLAVLQPHGIVGRL